MIHLDAMQPKGAELSRDGAEAHHSERPKQSLSRAHSYSKFSLTSHEIYSVRQSWKQVRRQQSNEPGLSITERLLATPDINKLFGFRSNTFQQRQININEHAKKLTKQLDWIMENLEDIESVQQNLDNLGRMHATIRSERITGNQWNIFSEILMEEGMKFRSAYRKHSSTTRLEAWARLVLFIIDSVTKGYNDQRSNFHGTIQSPRDSSSYLNVKDSFENDEEKNELRVNNSRLPLRKTSSTGPVRNTLIEDYSRKLSLNMKPSRTERDIVPLPSSPSLNRRKQASLVVPRAHGLARSCENLVEANLQSVNYSYARNDWAGSEQNISHLYADELSDAKFARSRSYRARPTRQMDW